MCLDKITTVCDLPGPISVYKAFSLQYKHGKYVLTPWLTDGDIYTDTSQVYTADTRYQIQVPSDTIDVYMSGYHGLHMPGVDLATVINEWCSPTSVLLEVMFFGVHTIGIEKSMCNNNDFVVYVARQMRLHRLVYVDPDPSVWLYKKHIMQDYKYDDVVNGLVRDIGLQTMCNTGTTSSN